MMILYFLLFLGPLFYLFGGLMVFPSFMLIMLVFYLNNSLALGMYDVGYVDSFIYIDMLSFLMLILCLLIFSVVYLLSLNNQGGYKFFLYYLLMGSLFLSFLSSNMYMYYFFFEFSMVPIFLLIIGSGSGQDRVISSYYMMIYTFVTSVPSLFIFVNLFMEYGSGDYNLFMLNDYEVSGFFLFFIMVMFLVKVPMFMFHVWLPKAHVDAPVSGSVILASIMLKLGGYGIFRLLSMFTVSFDLLVLFYCVGLLGFFIMSGFSLLILDVKVLIAYSSVVHMCLMLCGVCSSSNLGWVGGIMMMISHGLCSSCMFIMANMAYVRCGSRCMLYNKGFHSVMPVFSYLWLICIMFNIGAPPSLSFFSEVFSVIGALSLDWVGFVFIISGLFFISCSMVLLYNSFNMGGDLGVSNGLLVCDYFIIFIHLIVLVLMVFITYLCF